MKILITGASGFLGKNIIEKLSEESHTLILLSRKESLGKVAKNKSEIYFEEGDIVDLNSLRNVKKKVSEKVGKIDQVLHLAAFVPKYLKEDNMPLAVRVNVGGTSNVLETFGADLVGMVYASTAEVYGMLRGEGTIDESFPTNPPSFYSAAKLEGEVLCEAYSQKKSVPISILRVATLYGPGDLIDRAVTNFIRTALLGKNIEIQNGKNVRDYLHVQDAAQAFCKALEINKNGVFNIGSGSGTEIRKVAESIINIIDPKLMIAEKENSDKPSNFVLNIDKARKLLGFSPKIIFPDRLEEEIEWIRKN